MADRGVQVVGGGKQGEQGGLGFAVDEGGSGGRLRETGQDSGAGADGSKEREEAATGEADRDEAVGREESDHGWDQFGPEPELEDAFEGLKLHGEEEEDLDLSREVEELIKDVRWLYLFRVHTMRPFSHAALLNSMRNAWACAQGVTFNIKGPNLFLAQCHCLGEWKCVMEGGPWQFR